MAFWGTEVKPGEPYIHRCSDERGRLHVSQATIGNGSSSKKTILQCEVGNKNPIYLCSLLPKRIETCALNLEFDEDDEVTFSIVGSHSVHLSGFFYGEDEDKDGMEDDEYGSDPYGEDIMGTDSEDENDSIEYNSEDEDESDDYSGDDLGMYPSSTAPNSGVRIEEIVDDDKPANDDMSKPPKKQKTQSSMPDNNEHSNRQIVCKSGNGSPLLESEDEDGFPISTCEKMPDISKYEAKLEETNGQKVDEKTQKSNDKDDVAHVKNLEGNIDAKCQDAEVTRENTEPHGSSGQRDASITKNEVKKKKKNKKKKAAEKIVSAQESGIPNTSGTEESPVAETGNDPKTSLEKKKAKKKKKQNKGEESIPTSNPEGKFTDNNVSVPKKQEKEVKSSQVRTFANGLTIEELAMGKPDGKRASPGKRVTVHYIGKLKKNGKIFDSNIGRAPFKFRLGIGEVIKGWDVGVNGMRIGDKRRLTIPPGMGYGAKGAGGQIPPNSWLVFDVELVDVN